MASQSDEQLEWPATKVRDTFLDYFKQNGHTFGKFFEAPAPPITFLIRHSPIFVRRALVGSHSALHKCWNEPVQVHFPRNSRSPIRFRPTEARCKFSKGAIS